MFTFRRITNLFILLFVTLSLFATPSRQSVQASILQVCPTCTFTTIQAAVDSAWDGDEIQIAGGTYQGVSTQSDTTQMVFIEKSVTLKGGYKDAFSERDLLLYPTRIDAQVAGRGITIVGPATVTLDGLTIINGDATGQGAQAFDGASGGCRADAVYGAAGKGGGICAEGATLTVIDSVIANNYATRSGSQHGYGGGIYTLDCNLTITNTRLENNYGNDHWWGWGAGLYVRKGVAQIENNVIQNNQSQLSIMGGIALSMPTTAVVRQNTFQGNIGQAINACAQTSLTIENNQVLGNTAGIVADGTECPGTTTIRGNVIHDNTGTGLSINQPNAVAENNVIRQNGANGQDGGGIYLSRNGGAAILVLRHNTIVGNRGNNGIYVFSGKASFVNNIIASHTVGIAHSHVNPIVTMTNSLFFGNGSDIVGTSITATGSVIGDPVLAADGYHLMQNSAAIDKGVVTDLALDIDGDPRVRGAAPDIGADESPFGVAPHPGISFGKAALSPHWVYQPAALGGGYLDQQYLLRFIYGAETGSPDISSLTISDDLPDALQVYGQTSSGLQFSQNGQDLTWQAVQPLAPGDEHWIRIDARSTSGPGLTLTNTATAGYQLNGEDRTLDTSAQSSYPLLPPLIVRPGNGEFCKGDFTIQGLAQPNVQVKVYENAARLLGTATANAEGEWNLPFTYAGTPGTTLITAKAVANGKTSASSSQVTLSPSQSFWCPQRSGFRIGTTGNYWQGFRDSNGNFSTSSWNFQAGAEATLSIHINVTACAENGAAPLRMVLRIGDTDYEGLERNTDRIDWDFSPINLGTGIFTIEIQEQCTQDVWNKSSGGSIKLIDPDGYVFDSTLGFSIQQPQQNAIKDATVTCMAWLPEWGGWTPWPASVYGQTNPQRTDATTLDGITTPGYFAFFTPPGKYYLLVEGAAGYQSWRSPVVEVVSEIVHVNVPLMPTYSEAVSQVRVSPEGVEPSALTVWVGDSLEWLSTLSKDASEEDWIHYAEEPIIHLLSDLNPLENVYGWDSGLLAPGGVYRMKFIHPGRYTYTNGAGHSATVVVQAKVYLPMITK